MWCNQSQINQINQPCGPSDIKTHLAQIRKHPTQKYEQIDIVRRTFRYRFPHIRFRASDVFMRILHRK